jgi:curved DNA-binding protein CbpA
MNSLYDLLELKNSANAEEIKKAYRKKANQYHPDKNPGDTEAAARFREITLAYEVLSNPERRQEYDTTGKYAEDNGKGNPYADIFPVIQQTFTVTISSLVKNGRSPKFVDVVKEMKLNIHKDILEANRKKDELVKAKKELENNVLGRFETDLDDNLLDRLTRREILFIENGIKNHEKAIEVLHKVLDCLKHYKFKFENLMTWRWQPESLTQQVQTKYKPRSLPPSKE